MANIGFLNANERGSFIGKIETLAFTNVIALRPVQSSNPNAPKFDMMARSAANSWIKIGAVFEHENTGNKRGHGSAGSTGLKMGQSC